ncbi:hypothetical protein NDU88_005664 [Pleurodeles waltl]|uniref:Uncharacterized protein n=1 Tax=Pleurodeles waltl TaxID=8319 RepID=A0AAV7TXT2_PLEWA|nr:hypothetical protein NDU88_005664 [Pleurodeles waltl]
MPRRVRCDYTELPICTSHLMANDMLRGNCMGLAGGRQTRLAGLLHRRHKMGSEGRDPAAIKPGAREERLCSDYCMLRT